MNYVTVVTLFVYCFVVYLEEPELRERFGKQYEDYCRRVPRWLPRLDTLAGGRRYARMLWIVEPVTPAAYRPA